MMLSSFDPETLSHLGQHDSEYVLYILIEYGAFFTDEVALSIAKEFISYINISPKNAKSLSNVYMKRFKML